MRRESHVRFSEGPGVQFPRATRLVIVFEREEDARRVLDVLSKRFDKYNLRLHPEKTRLVPFRRPPMRRVPIRAAAERPGTFDLLGFTHFWSRSRNGFWVVLRKTARSRLSRALKGISLWLRENRHEPIREQHRVLVKKVSGHYGYFGITGNYSALDSFRYWVRLLWCKWLSRRSNASRFAPMNKLLEAYPLPRPRIVRTL